MTPSVVLVLMAEDCDVLVLLKHHGARSAGDIFFTT